jgi:diguanylate cyclase (GGDEF)-like protein
LLGALAIALVITPLTTSIIISIAIAAYEGGIVQRVVGELVASWWIHPVASVVPVMTVAVIFVEPLLAPVAAIPIAGMWYLVNSFGKQRQALRDLDAVQGFVGRIGRSLDAAEIAELALAEMAHHIRSAGSVVVRFTDDGPIVTKRGAIPLRLPQHADDEEWTALLDRPPGHVVPGSELGSVWEGAGDPPPALVALLRDGGETLGVLIALQRSLLGTEFEDGDAGRFQSIAEQLAVSLRRGILHERLEHEARHDALTDLPGRTLFERAVGDALTSDSGGVWVVMMLDLDRFKEVNDTLGHHAGDTLLVEFSRRMSELLGPTDVLARLAGDEFAILCHRPTYDDVLEMAESVLRSGSRPVTLDGLEIVVTVSVGVAEITEADDDPLQPMRRADIAMYNAKWQRTGVELYRDEIDRRTPARLSMLGDLRAAIEEDQLDVVYQPKLDLRTGTVTGAEALVRWEHETRGVVAPTEFVRVAEDTGLIKDLTDLVLARGIEALRQFEAQGLEIGLAVNLSTHDLFDGRLPDRVRGYLTANEVRPESLTLEITESSLLVDAPRTRATLDDLHAVGLQLAVDDFGTGYSSLSYLRRLPVQELKIDRSFVSGMLDDPQDEVIVRSTIDLGHNLGLRVVAEGAESVAVLERLSEFGCDVAQGYSIAAPMSADELVTWVSAAHAERGGVAGVS